MIDAGRRAMQRKHRRNLVLLAIVSVLAAGLTGYRVVGRLGEASAGTASEPPVAPTTNAPAPQMIAVTWPLDVPRDPFQEIHPQLSQAHGVEARPSAGDLYQQAAQLIHLQGIITSREPMVMINGTLHRRGQLVHGFRIKEIHSRRVVLERNGIDIELRL